MIDNSLKSAANLHGNVPPDWYYRSIKENILQRYWHGRRFEEVTRLIEQNSKAKILDIGSADGVFTKVILDTVNAASIVGIDVLKASVLWANKHWKKEQRLKFKLGNAHDLRFHSNSFDAVFALEVLEHVPEPGLVLKEVKRVLKKGGYAVFLVPTDNGLFKVVWFLWRKWRGRIWNDCHVQSFTGKSLPQLAKKLGFKVQVEKRFILGMLLAVKIRKV